MVSEDVGSTLSSANITPESLFASTASRERKFWGFLLFQKLIQDPASYSKLFSSIFSHNLVRCLINHVQEKDRFLNRAADKSLKAVIQTVEIDPQTLLTFLPQLIGGNGTYSFDKVTKTKIIEKFLTKVDEMNAKSIIDALVLPTIVIEQYVTTAQFEFLGAPLTVYLALIPPRRQNCVDNSSVIIS